MTDAIASLAPEAIRLRDGFDVLDVCHRQSVLSLGKLAALVTGLDRHGPDDDLRALAREILEHFSVDVRAHHADEERHLFPRLLAEADADTIQLVERLAQDHAWIEQNWREIEPQLDAIASGQAWFDRDFLRSAVAVFAALMHEHIALEESQIYPDSRARMTASDREAMRLEMATRRVR